MYCISTDKSDLKSSERNFIGCRMGPRPYRQKVNVSVTDEPSLQHSIRLWGYGGKEIAVFRRSTAHCVKILLAHHLKAALIVLCFHHQLARAVLHKNISTIKRGSWRNRSSYLLRNIHARRSEGYHTFRLTERLPGPLVSTK